MPGGRSGQLLVFIPICFEKALIHQVIVCLKQLMRILLSSLSLSFLDKTLLKNDPSNPPRYLQLPNFRYPLPHIRPSPNLINNFPEHPLTSLPTHLLAHIRNECHLKIVHLDLRNDSTRSLRLIRPNLPRCSSFDSRFYVQAAAEVLGDQEDGYALLAVPDSLVGRALEVDVDGGEGEGAEFWDLDTFALSNDPSNVFPKSIPHFILSFLSGQTALFNCFLNTIFKCLPLEPLFLHFSKNSCRTTRN